MKDLRKKLSPLFKKVWPTLSVAIIVIAFFWKFFFKNLIPVPGDFVVGVYYPWLDYKWGYSVGVPVKNPITADVPSFIFPMQTYATDIIKSGNLPLWNPLILMGTPLLANFQSAPFSVTNLLYLITDKLTAWSLQIVLQHFFSAIFVYILLRYWKVSKLGSILGGVIFAFSGFNVIWSEWNGHALSASFIPLIILFEDKLLKEGKVKSGVGFSLALCSQVLSGYPQVVLYTVLVSIILALVRMFQNLSKTIFVRIGFLGIFAILGLGLASFQILPGFELLKFSQRTVEPHPFEWAFLPWQKSITFISSDYFGNHSTNNYWGPQDYTSNTGFVGIVGFVLSLITFSLIKKNKEILFCFLLVVVSLVLSFPTPLSIFLWKSGFLGFNAAAAHRSLVIFNLAIALLAGFGYDKLGSKIGFKNIFLPLLIPFLMIFGFAIEAYLIRTKTIHGQSIFPIAIRNLFIPLFIFGATSFIVIFKRNWKVLLIALSIVELFYFGWKFLPFSSRNIVFPTTPVIDFIKSQEKPFRVTGNKVIPMNILMAYDLESPEGYDAVYTKTMAKFISALNDGSGDTKFSGRYGSIDRVNSRLLDLINTKYFFVLKASKEKSPDPNGFIPEAYNNKKYKKVFEDKSVAVLENTNALPRAFMVYDWEILKEESEILDKILDPNFPIDKKIILEDSIPGIPEASQVKIFNTVKYQKYNSQGSKINISTEKDGLLFVSDLYYPGWKVYINGKESKIYKANHTFRATLIPKGDHTINFAYKPDTFFKGVWAGAFSLIALIAILLLY